MNYTFYRVGVNEISWTQNDNHVRPNKSVCDIHGFKLLNKLYLFRFYVFHTNSFVKNKLIRQVGTLVIAEKTHIKQRTIQKYREN